VILSCPTSFPWTFAQHHFPICISPLGDNSCSWRISALKISNPQLSPAAYTGHRSGKATPPEPGPTPGSHPLSKRFCCNEIPQNNTLCNAKHRATSNATPDF
jgi:hypothetical protein